MPEAANTETNPIGIPALDADAWHDMAAHLRVPLTVVLARSQLLQRRIRHGQVWDAAACMETLATIDDAVRQMETRLRDFEDELARP